MISRRNIRINVLQTIYETNQQEKGFQEAIAIKNLASKFDKTNELYIASIQLMYAITQYVLIYANQRASKMAPTFEDLHVKTKIAGNTIIESLKMNENFADLVKKYKLAHLFDEDTIKSLFLLLSKSSEYQTYISSEERTPIEEKQILETIMDICIFGNEDTASLLAEIYMNWYNDFEMIYTWFQKMLMNTKQAKFNKIIGDVKLEYAEELLKCYYNKKQIVFDIINPKLVNWDSERIANIDLIILHLGVCEFLYFETIPFKVTINEYIDLAKSYSTQQSGQFINGLLDNVRKDLEKNNLVYKTDFHKK